MADADVLLAVPVRLTLCVPPAALSVTVTAAVRDPVADGLKVTLIAHLAPAATLEPQVFVWAKSPALAPETAMLVMLKAAVPELVRVTVCAALVVATAWPANVRLVGDRLATGFVAAGFSATICIVQPLLAVAVAA